jgi:hypothetical protein
MSPTALGLAQLVHSAVHSTPEVAPVVEAHRRWHVTSRVLGLAIAAALGCDGSDRSPAAGPVAAGAGGAQADVPTGGQGGTGDSSDASTPPIGGAGGSGNTPSDAGAAGDGQGGGDGPDPVDGGSNDAGGGEEPAAVWSCDGDYAFGADATLEFIDPTPTALASALTTVTGATYPISLVLHLEEGALIGALSATIDDGSGLDIFLPSDVPLLEPVVAAFGSPPGVTSVDPQPNAVLRFEDQAGTVDIQVEHVVWRATQNTTCADMTVSLQAVIPTSQFSVVLHLPSGDQTIGELISSSSSDQPDVTPIGGPTPPPTPVEIAATFQGVPLDFDFDSL